MLLTSSGALSPPSHGHMQRLPVLLPAVLQTMALLRPQPAAGCLLGVCCEECQCQCRARLHTWVHNEPAVVCAPSVFHHSMMLTTRCRVVALAAGGAHPPSRASRERYVGRCVIRSRAPTAGCSWGKGRWGMRAAAGDGGGGVAWRIEMHSRARMVAPPRGAAVDAAEVRSPSTVDCSALCVWPRTLQRRALMSDSDP